MLRDWSAEICSPLKKEPKNWRLSLDSSFKRGYIFLACGEKLIFGLFTWITLVKVCQSENIFELKELVRCNLLYEIWKSSKKSTKSNLMLAINLVLFTIETEHCLFFTVNTLHTAKPTKTGPYSKRGDQKLAVFEFEGRLYF